MLIMAGRFYVEELVLNDYDEEEETKFSLRLIVMCRKGKYD